MTMFLYIVLLLLSVFLILIVLLQRGRGGGLAGAFGAGGGAQTAFGTKTGDVFTWVTVIAFVLFMLLSIGQFMKIKWGSSPDQTPGRDAVQLKLGQGQDDAINITSNSLTLVWKDQSSNAIGYHILQTDDVNQDPAPVVKDGVVVNVPANNPSGHYSYTITDLRPSTTYYFVVEAWNNTPQSSRSPSPKQRATNSQLAVLTGTTIAAPPGSVLTPSAGSAATRPTAGSQTAPAATVPASAGSPAVEATTKPALASAPVPETKPTTATATAPAATAAVPATTKPATAATHP